MELEGAPRVLTLEKMRNLLPAGEAADGGRGDALALREAIRVGLQVILEHQRDMKAKWAIGVP
jgi:hypothetical protein